jgi:hypothetical protein
MVSIMKSTPHDNLVCRIVFRLRRASIAQGDVNYNGPKRYVFR